MSERAALRVVVDTNVFVSGVISPRGRPRRLLHAWQENLFELLLSDSQYVELTDVLGRPKIVWRYQVAPAMLGDLFVRLSRATRVPPSLQIPVPLCDPNDEHILASAVDGGAHYLVTGDGDLLACRNDPRLGALEIVTVAEFLAVLDERASKGQSSMCPD